MSSIRYAVIGCGQRARYLTWLLAQHAEVELAGLWDPNSDQCDLLCDQVKQPRAVARPSSYKELLSDASISWVMVASPNAYHREHIEAALVAGKHVFAEKPLATTVEDCLALAGQVGASDRLLMTGFTLRYTGLYRQVKSVIAEGRLGKVVAIDANENLTPGHGAYIMTNWRRHHAVAGAHILEKCVHDLDLLNWFTGSLPVRVAAFGGNSVFVPENQGLFARSERFVEWRDVKETGLNPFTSEKSIEDTFVAILEYQNGARAQFQLTSSNAINERRMFLSGTEGTAVVDLETGVLRVGSLFAKEQTVWNFSGGGHGGGDEVMIGELVAAMTQGTKPPTGIEQGLQSTLVGLSLDQARRERRIVDLTDLWPELAARLKS